MGLRAEREERMYSGFLGIVDLPANALFSKLLLHLYVAIEVRLLLRSCVFGAFLAHEATDKIRAS